MVSLILVVVGGAVAIHLLPGTGFQPARFAVFFSIVLEGVLIYCLRARKPIISRAILLFGPTLSFSLALKVIESPAVSFFSTIIVIVNAAINPLTGFAAAILNTIPLYFTLFPKGLLIPALALLWLAAVMSWVSSRALYTALGWAWQSGQRANRLLVELRDRRGELKRTLAALTEATRRLERANRELAIARQQADEARVLKEQFVANVSHELRTPLNLIVGFAEMMYLTPDVYKDVIWTPDLMSDLGRVYRAGQHLQALVNDILDLARIDAARLPLFREFADIHAIVNEAVVMIAPILQRRGLSYKIVGSRKKELFVDRTRIRQVMLNLLNNGARFTDEGLITVQIEETKESVVVSVHDTGVGISEDQLERIFEEFSQGNAGPRGRGGAGLGLAISRQFVELHGGRIWAESELGVGSTFYFSLPLPGAMPQTVSLKYTPERRRLDHSRDPVIVVDPDPGIADMLSRYLGDHPALAARDAAEAERLVEAEHPLAIIANNLPETPVETWLGSLGEFSERYSVPVIRCSIPSPSWLQQSAGIDDCLTKPVSRESLRSLLERYCRKPSTILVVDDDLGFVSLMVRMLGTMELADEVLTAYSGVDALRLARERVPDLLLLDLLMPEMDGFQVVEALRRDPALRDISVVAVTATSYAEEMLSRRGGYFTVTQSKGLSTGMLTEFLSVALKVLQPNYVGEDRTSWRI